MHAVGLSTPLSTVSAFSSCFNSTPQEPLALAGAQSAPRLDFAAIMDLLRVSEAETAVSGGGGGSSTRAGSGSVAPFHSGQGLLGASGDNSNGAGGGCGASGAADGGGGDDGREQRGKKRAHSEPEEAPIARRTRSQREAQDVGVETRAMKVSRRQKRGGSRSMGMTKAGRPKAATKKPTASSARSAKRARTAATHIEEGPPAGRVRRSSRHGDATSATTGRSKRRRDEGEAAAAEVDAGAGVSKRARGGGGGAVTLRQPASIVTGATVLGVGAGGGAAGEGFGDSGAWEAGEGVGGEVGVGEEAQMAPAGPAGGTSTWRTESLAAEVRYFSTLDRWGIRRRAFSAACRKIRVCTYRLHDTLLAGGFVSLARCLQIRPRATATMTMTNYF